MISNWKKKLESNPKSTELPQLHLWPPYLHIDHMIEPRSHDDYDELHEDDDVDDDGGGADLDVGESSVSS